MVAKLSDFGAAVDCEAVGEGGVVNGVAEGGS